ncbi:MAG: DUF6264 family protein [Microbacterium sp.]|uniref:DUF6264 family protein n=1 Tax=Microbacterium sp. TaxID=51671 RepID=UPI0039E3C691
MSGTTDPGQESPRPRYGEYATPEEQRARMQQPDPSLPWESGHAEHQPAPAAAPTAGNGPVARRRPVDRIVTIALLAYGAINVLFSVPSYFGLEAVIGRTLRMMGMEGEFTNLDAARLWGPVAAIVLVVGYAVTAVLTLRRLRVGALAWWAPLVGAVATYIVVGVCFAVPMLGDPAFIQHISST